MKDRQLQTKRKAKRGFRALYAKTMERKQKASTAAASPSDIEGDIPKVGIGRALTVILILHIVAIAAIYMGTKWKGPESNGSNAVVASNDDSTENVSKTNSSKQHKFRVGQPSSYQQFERSPEVANSVATQRANTITPPREVHTPAVQDAPVRQPRVIRPRRNPNAYANLPSGQDSSNASFKMHTIVSGDTIYRIALRNKVKQQAILDLNNITDARKIRVGMKIKVPVN